MTPAMAVSCSSLLKVLLFLGIRACGRPRKHLVGDLGCGVGYY